MATKRGKDEKDIKRQKLSSALSMNAEKRKKSKYKRYGDSECDRAGEIMGLATKGKFKSSDGSRREARFRAGTKEERKEAATILQACREGKSAGETKAKPKPKRKIKQEKKEEPKKEEPGKNIMLTLTHHSQN